MKLIRAFLFIAAAAVCGCAVAATRSDWITVGPVFASKDYNMVPAYSFSGLKKPWRAVGIVRSPLMKADDNAGKEEYVLQARKLAAQYGADAVVAKVVEKTVEAPLDGSQPEPPLCYIWAVAVKLEENVGKETPLSTDVFKPENGLPGLVSEDGSSAAPGPVLPGPAAPGSSSLEKELDSLPFK